MTGETDLKDLVGIDDTGICFLASMSSSPCTWGSQPEGLEPVHGFREREGRR